jgi:hypothetical protein
LFAKRGRDPLWALQQLIHPWSESFSGAVLESLERSLPSKDPNFRQQLLWCLKDIGLRFHRAFLPRLLDLLAEWAANLPQAAKTLGEVRDLLQFRHEMSKEFTA